MLEWLSSRRAAPYLFLAPALLFGLLLFLGPLLFAAYISFTDWNGVASPHWVGLENYTYLLQRDPFFFKSVWNTLYFAAGSVVVGVPAALVAAALISRSRFQSFWRTVYWLPMITNIVAVAYIWWYILNDTSGLLNRALDLFHLPGPNWLTSPSTAMFSVIMVASWMSIGQNVLVFLSGLGEIDETYYEAAKLDGANPLQLFWHVTIPLLRPTILFVLRHQPDQRPQLVRADADPDRGRPRPIDHGDRAVPLRHGLHRPAAGARIGRGLHPVRHHPGDQPHPAARPAARRNGSALR